MLKEGAAAYEVAVALHENVGADVLAEKILSVQASDHTFALLIKAARRAGSRERAHELYERATREFTNRQLSESTKALGGRFTRASKS